MSFTPHTLVEFVGTWNYSDTTAETWAFGVRIAAAPGDWGGLANPAEWIATVGPALKAWFQSSTNFMANTALLQLIKCNNITAEGHYADPVTHQYNAGAAAGGITSSLPVMVTACITWDTGLSRGRARRGRIYPPVGLPLSGGGATMGAGAQSSLITSGKNLLTALHTVSTSQPVAPVPIVASKIDGSANLIKGVSADTRYDVQRRRIKQVKGLRVASVWP